MSEQILTDPSRCANEESALLLSTNDGLTENVVRNGVNGKISVKRLST